MHVAHLQVDAASVPDALDAHLPVVPGVERREHDLVEIVAEPVQPRGRRHQRPWAGTRAPPQPLYGIPAARALVSGPEDSPEQAGGLAERQGGPWAAASNGTLWPRRSTSRSGARAGRPFCAPRRRARPSAAQAPPPSRSSARTSQIPRRAERAAPAGGMAEALAGRRSRPDRPNARSMRPPWVG
eukprot:scaffold112313_cov45-Phaeocystis_antarctica.AAC.3